MKNSLVQQLFVNDVIFEPSGVNLEMHWQKMIMLRLLAMGCLCSNSLIYEKEYSYSIQNTWQCEYVPIKVVKVKHTTNFMYAQQIREYAICHKSIKYLPT